MSGFGAMDAMKKSYDQNRSLLRRKKLIEVLNEQGYRTKVKKIRYKKASSKNLESLRNELKKKNKNDALKRLIVLIITALMVCIPLVYLLFL